MEAVFRHTIWCFTDLSKVFDSLPYELLAAKLNAYGLETWVVRLIFDQLSDQQEIAN